MTKPQSYVIFLLHAVMHLRLDIAFDWFHGLCLKYF